MLKKLKEINPASFFVVAAFFLEVLLNLVTPPLQVPDEFNHFYRAYQVSEGNFLPTKKDQRLGGYMPQGIIDFTDQYRNSEYNRDYSITHQEILYSFSIEPNEQKGRMKDFANTAYYAPVSYLPHAFILFVLRQFHASPGILYYGGRLFMFFLWLFCMYRIIKLLPAFKWLFTFLALLPVNLYLVNSFSADTVTNILSFLFIALVLKHVFVTENIQPRHVVVLGLVLILLALAKIVYIGLAVLLLAIPGRKFGSVYHRATFLVLLLVVSGVPVMLWSHVVMKLYIPFKEYNPAYTYEATLSACANYYAQKEYLLGHGLYFLKVLWNSTVTYPCPLLFTYIGVFGKSNVSPLWWFYTITYAVLFLVIFSEKNKFTFSVRQKLIVLLAAVSAYVLLVLSQYLIWDCVGSDLALSIMGRYLAPILPLVFMALYTPALPLKFNPALLVVPFVLLLNGYGCYLLYQRFFVPPPAVITEIYCGAEETKSDDLFKTSDPKIFLGGAHSRNSNEHHSGKYSALLSPVSAYTFVYTFKGLHKGDLVEVEAWEKGEGGFLIVSGKQPGCGDFYFGGMFKSGPYKDGWRWIKNVYPYGLNCDSVEVGIYGFNPSGTNYYLDDLKIKITRFVTHRDSL